MSEYQDKWVRRKPGHNVLLAPSLWPALITEDGGTVHQLRDLDPGAPERSSCTAMSSVLQHNSLFCKIILYTGENWTQPWEIFIRNGLVIVIPLIPSSMGVCMGQGRGGGQDGCYIPIRSFLRAHFGG